MQNQKGQLFRWCQKEEMIAMESKGWGQMVEGLGATNGVESRRDGVMIGQIY